jgi:thiol-disulfide isomerase/thioredoxin
LSNSREKDGINPIIDINAGELEDYTTKGNPVLLMIWIKGCDQCRRFKPVFNQLPEHYPTAQFLSMNMYKTMDNLRLAENYEKETTPIILVFCRGEHHKTFIGYYSLENFKMKLDEVFNENSCFS